MLSSKNTRSVPYVEAQREIIQREPLDRIQVRWSPEVQGAIEYFLHKDPGHLLEARRNARPYVGRMIDIFNAEGLPVGLLNVAAIESKHIRKAKSSYGARGIWQFMPATARSVGLKVNLLTDQRTDPVLSTQAAAKYLWKLHKRFDDWYWALASYNAGPTKVARIYQQAQSKVFWDNSHLLPVETQKFVGKVIAAIVIKENRIEIKSYERSKLAQIINRLRRRYV